MKHRLFLLCLLVTQIIRAGGVTIGNGSSHVVGIELPSFKEERDLLLFTKGLLDEARSGRLLRVKLFKKQGRCNEHFNDLRGVETYGYYPRANATEQGERYVKGQLLVELRDCKTPELIEHDGFEDIDVDNLWEL